ncbi:MAG: preprotein translocase subunit SecE [Candidatus Marinimicrobia bacterium]|nr:preprotein translocase subunit SecE [Candidatus Neomarinimicrobiota bacterium]MBL7109952.1 preprotein translocase subunit SecE [Candidatus Neomarinimicrobiota bacterium]
MLEKITNYFGSIGVEMKKVTWLSKDELLSSTVIVGVFSVIVAIFLFFIDFGLSELMSIFLGGN